MNYTIIIIIAIVGIILGYQLACLRRQAKRKQGNLKEGTKQSREKEENKQKILDYLYKNGRIQNNDVEKLTGVTHSSAERYLNELEKQGKLTQHGKVGTDVFYTLK